MITGRVIKRFLNVSMKGIVVTFHILGEFEERCLEKNSDLCIEGAISILKRVDQLEQLIYSRDPLVQPIHGNMELDYIGIVVLMKTTDLLYSSWIISKLFSIARNLVLM